MKKPRNAQDMEVQAKPTETGKPSQSPLSTLRQSDFPAFSIEKAIVIARSLWDDYGGNEMPPIDVASALKISPTSSNWRYLPGASSAYGLTTGSYGSAKMSLTELGKRAVGPTREGEDSEAIVEAVCLPTIAKRIFSMYEEKKWPSFEIARNVLISAGVPVDKIANIWSILEANFEYAGMFTTIQGSRYLRRKPNRASLPQSLEPLVEATDEDENTPIAQAAVAERTSHAATIMSALKEENKRVFITHGKNRELVESIKSLLSLADLEPVVSVQRSTVAEPIPDKVMREMRSCSAAIIHVDIEDELTDGSDHIHQILNDNVLIEIGMAMALYGRRFILLVKEGVSLPSNLTGLFEVRYGESVDMATTLKLIDALRNMKNTPTGV